MVTHAKRRIRNPQHVVIREDVRPVEPDGYLDHMFNKLDVAKVVLHLKDGSTQSFEAIP